MTHYLPYTYLIGWSNLDKWYYGVRYAKNANPSEFWITYFTSSRIVKEFREKYGEPDIIEIRQTFKSQAKARDWEYNVLKRLKVKNDLKWLNQCENRFPFNTKDKSYMKTPEYRAKLSASKKGKPAHNKGKPSPAKGMRMFTNGVEQRKCFPGNEPEGWWHGSVTKPWNKGIPHPPKTREKIRLANLRRYQA
jgi:hypothetical protein